MLERFALVQRSRVAFADVDMMRHANNLAYLRWAEHGRTEYFSEVIGEPMTGASGMILARLVVDYERPVLFRARVAVGTRVARIGGKSLDFEHEVWDEDAGARCARIVSTTVAMDYATDLSIRVPQTWRDRIAAYELAAP